MKKYKIHFYIKPIGFKRVDLTYVLASKEDLNENSADIIIKKLMSNELLSEYPYNETWQIVSCTEDKKAKLGLSKLVIKKEIEKPIIKSIKKPKKKTPNLDSAYNFKESGLIDRSGKIYYCAFSEHLELIKDLHQNGTIDTDRIISDEDIDDVYRYDSLLSWPENNGWVKFSMGTFHFGNTARKGIYDYSEYDWKFTLEQLKSITYLLAIQGINYIRINADEQPMLLTEFLKFVDDNSYNIINKPNLNLGKDYIGNKAFNLSKLNAFNFNIPDFIIIPNDTCLRILKDGLVTDSLISTLKLPDAHFYSVRSSAPISMPGMLDTILKVNQENLKSAIWQVINSWYNQKAIDYRKLLNIPEDNKISVIIQSYINTTVKNSGSGVCIITDKNFYGEYLSEMTGEKLVSGKETPKNISQLPEKILIDLKNKAEKIFTIQYKIPQEIEFCFLEEELYILQTRDYKHIVETTDVIEGKTIALGRKGHIGVAIGRIVFDALDIQTIKGPKIYVAFHTAPEEVLNMSKCVGVMTAVGGALSHAAVAAKNLNIVCVAGAGFKIEEKTVIFDKGIKLQTGDLVIIDGNTGEIKIKTNDYDRKMVLV